MYIFIIKSQHLYHFFFFFARSSQHQDTWLMLHIKDWGSFESVGFPLHSCTLEPHFDCLVWLVVFSVITLFERHFCLEPLSVTEIQRHFPGALLSLTMFLPVVCFWCRAWIFIHWLEVCKISGKMSFRDWLIA